MCVGLWSSASSGWAGAAFSIVPSVPTNVTVGQTGVPAALTITNASFDGAGQSDYTTDSFQLTQVTLVPSCGSQVASADCPAGSHDPGVLVPSATGSGRAGTACADRTFTISNIDAVQGKHSFTPDAPVVLGDAVGPPSASRCILDFTFNVAKAPLIDSHPNPGVQTDHKAFTAATDITLGPNVGQTGTGIGTNRITVAQAVPAIATQASAGFTLGAGALSDTATVSGLVNPVTGAGAGTVEFRLYGPDDATCAAAVFISASRPLTLSPGNTVGTATSGLFGPTAAGTYRWRAFYSGDANNAPVAGACNDANESTVVGPAAPTIATQASAGFTLGAGTLSDTATVSGLVNPVTGLAAGTVEFRLYGPDDATCAAALFTSSSRPLTINLDNTAGTATSASFTPTAAGTYRWRAFYSGDANNAPVAGACNDANESTVVGPAAPTIATQASAGFTLGAGTLSDTATVSGLVNPVTGLAAGTVEFRLYGPDDATCTTAVFTSSNRPLTLDAGGTTGTATSEQFTPTASGTYRWRAFYSGDANNAPVAGACNDANETTDVAAPPAPVPTPSPTPGPGPTPAPPVTPPAPPVTPLTCEGRTIALVDVHLEGSRVILAGLALPRFAGQTATITASSGGSKVTAKVQSDGTFAASTRAPARARRARTTYTARVGGQTSAALRLNRRFVIVSTRPTPAGLRVTARVVGGKRGQRVELRRQLDCARTTSVRIVRLDRRGAFSAVLARPTGVDALAYYRAVALFKRSSSYTLPIVVRATP